MNKEDRSVNAMERIKAIASEHFTEHIVIVRCDDGDGSERYLRWNYSDPQWARGAMERVERVIKEYQP